MKKSKIVIIDSGVSLPQQAGDAGDGIFLEKSAFCQYRASSNIQDEIGHGTGIYGIIKQHHPQADIFNLKICDRKNNPPQAEDLLYALTYIYANIECKIINMCLSLSMTDDIQTLTKLEALCEQLDARGMILVSSFDNWGSLSYPATFRSVIGVTSGSDCYKNTDIEYVDNDIVNLCGHGTEQKVLSHRGGYTVSKGNSLACAHITGILSQFIESTMTKEDVLNRLKTLAIKHHTGLKKTVCMLEAPVENYKKAVVFPFNKEMHSLIRYQEMLPFAIAGVYDTKYSGYVHSTTNHLLHIDHAQNYTIHNVEKMDYQSFDTLILGHTDRIEKIKAINRQIKTLIDKCIKTQKYIFSFDDRNDQVSNYPRYFSPQIRKENIIPIPFGKLYRNPKPVLGVFGTSSRQGKFSLQLILRKYLSNLGYTVGQIGTEPTAALFGMDAGFHFGYNTNTDVVRYDTVSYLNQKINEIVRKDVDLIIAGCQSRSLPVDFGNVNSYTFSQEEFLFAVQPDVFILCVNPWDDLEYIGRTILFLESAVCGKVIALVVYPFDLHLHPEETSYETLPLTEGHYAHIKESFEKYFSLPVFHLGHDTDHSLLAQIVINSLS